MVSTQGSLFDIEHEDAPRPSGTHKPAVSTAVSANINTAHQDFGEKIGGAKKDLWQARGLNTDDLLEMNEREADKYVRKDNVWKKDYQKFIDDGVPADVVYFMKHVRDSISPTPVILSRDSDDVKAEKRKLYVTYVKEIQGIVESIKDKSDAQELFEKVIIGKGFCERRTQSNSGYCYYTEKGKNAPFELSKLFKALNDGKDNWKWLNYTATKKQFGVQKDEKLPKGYYIHFHDETAAKNTIRKDDTRKPNTYWISKKTAFGNIIVGENYETREKARKRINELVELDKDNQVKKRFVPPQLEHIERSGTDFRHGRNVNGQDYLDTFGFKGGEFGNWLSQNERQASLNYGYDALKDLAQTLQISDKDISYGGDLSIAFGARGSGNFVAHYEPMRKVINLTKMKGAGSLAHEWWHGLDDFLGSKFNANGYLSDRPRQCPQFQKLVETIKYKPATPEQMSEAAATAGARTRQNAESWLKAEVEPSIRRSGDEGALAEYEALKNAFLNGEKGCVDKLSELKKNITSHVIPREIRQKLEIFESRLSPEKTPTINNKVATDYFIASKDMGNISHKDGNYWDSNCEMTARAFACYIADKLDGKSDYLTGHAEAAIAWSVDRKGEPKEIKAFPQGEERQAINAAFDELFEHLKQTEIISHVGKYVPERFTDAAVTESEDEYEEEDEEDYEM